MHVEMVNPKNTVVTGMQHDVELLQQKVADLETLLHAERGITSELRHDTEALQKQLELVTRGSLLRSWVLERIFGDTKKQE